MKTQIGTVLAAFAVTFALSTTVHATDYFPMPLNSDPGSVVSDQQGQPQIDPGSFVPTQSIQANGPVSNSSDPGIYSAPDPVLNASDPDPVHCNVIIGGSFDDQGNYIPWSGDQPC